MLSFDATQMLDLWERARSLPLNEQAVELAAAVDPARPRAEIAQLPLGSGTTGSGTSGPFSRLGP